MTRRAGSVRAVRDSASGLRRLSQAAFLAVVLLQGAFPGPVLADVTLRASLTAGGQRHWGPSSGFIPMDSGDPEFFTLVNNSSDTGVSLTKVVITLPGPNPGNGGLWTWYYFFDVTSAEPGVQPSEWGTYGYYPDNPPGVLPADGSNTIPAGHVTPTQTDFSRVFELAFADGAFTPSIAHHQFGIDMDTYFSHTGVVEGRVVGDQLHAARVDFTFSFPYGSGTVTQTLTGLLKKDTYYSSVEVTHKYASTPPEPPAPPGVVIPAPPAVLLGAIGLGLVAVVRRRLRR